MTSGKRISKKLYLGILFGSIVVSFAPALLMRSGRDEASTWVLMAAGTAVLTVAMVILLAFWHQAWSAIQDGHARTTPARAVGFALIPLFNLYWIFQLAWGFSVDFNAYVARHKQDGRAVPAPYHRTAHILAAAYPEAFCYTKSCPCRIRCPPDMLATVGLCSSQQINPADECNKQSPQQN